MRTYVEPARKVLALHTTKVSHMLSTREGALAGEEKEEGGGGGGGR
jgi:hypothetical protein